MVPGPVRDLAGCPSLGSGQNKNGTTREIQAERPLSRIEAPQSES